MDNHDEHISKIMSNPEEVAKILQRGVNAALLKHKQAGVPIWIWPDDQLVCVPPEKIVIEE